MTTNPELTRLAEEYDALRELRKETSYIATRQERLEAIAKAARAGDELPDLREDPQSRTFKLQGIDLALEQVADEVIAQIALDHDDDLKIPLIEVPHGETFTSGDLLGLARERFDAAERGRAASEDRKEFMRSYDAALEKQQRQKAAWERPTEDFPEGRDPRGFSPNLTNEEWDVLKRYGGAPRQLAGSR